MDDDLRCEIEQRRAAVEKIERFKKSFFEQTYPLFEAAASAVRAAEDDYDSEVDAGIAHAIEEHMRAITRLCDYGNELGACIGKPRGFGGEHFVPDEPDEW